MVDLKRKHERLGHRYGRLVGVIFFVLIAIVGIFFALQLFWGTQFRETGILVGEPMAVFSWDNEEKKLVLVSIPADTTVDSVRGAGRYSLQSLWRLGTIDSRQKALLSESVEDALGVSVAWYIGHKGDALPLNTDPTVSVKKLFSFSQAFELLKGTYVRNMPISSFLRLTWELRLLRPDKITTITLSGPQVRSDVAMPDGSTAKLLDSDVVDILVSNIFEDSRIRVEGLRLAIYNTTPTPSLGTRVGRLLGHMGLSVVSVGNETPEVGVCELWGTEQVLQSLSAQFILNHYHCEKKIQTEIGKADLVLKLGRDIEEHFVGVHE